MTYHIQEAETWIRRSNDKFIWERAKYYWIAQITTALSKNHDYLGDSMCTMEDTIQELDPGEEEENSEDE